MLPYGRQYIDDDDVAAVADALRGELLTTGPKVEEFESAFAAAAGAAQAVSCCNGTAALHLAAMALELGPGDAVVVPTVTFLATANAVRYTGAEVVFCDVDPETGLMGPGHLEEALARAENLNVKAVFPVHLTGECVDLAEMAPLAKARGLKIVADACHAAGGTLYGKPVGACVHEDMSVFSFHPVKNFTTGEGGAVTANDADLAGTLRRLRGHGTVHGPMAPDMPSYYQMPSPGYNYRITDIQCALGLSQLKKLPVFAARRQELAALYDRLLAPLAPLVRRPVRHNYCQPVRHLYAPRIDFGQAGRTRAAVMEDLRARGIGTQVHYFPVHRQPYYRERYGAADLPGAELYYSRTLSLPYYYGVTDDDAVRVAAALKEVLS